MNYQRIYDQIIERAKHRKLEGYKEKHHIVPKCIGGLDVEENLVDLTAREHFICHWLLYRIYPDNLKLRYAFWCMCNLKNNKQQRYTVTSRTYQEARYAHAKNVSYTKAGAKQTKEHIENRVKARKNKGFKHSEQSKTKMSESSKGKTAWNKGIPRTEEVRKKISERLTGRIIGKQSRDYIEKRVKNRRKAIIHLPTGSTYNSYTEAATAFKCSLGTIANKVKSGIFKEI